MYNHAAKNGGIRANTKGHRSSPWTASAILRTNDDTTQGTKKRSYGQQPTWGKHRIEIHANEYNSKVGGRKQPMFFKYDWWKHKIKRKCFGMATACAAALIHTQKPDDRTPPPQTPKLVERNYDPERRRKLGLSLGYRADKTCQRIKHVDL